MNDELRLGCVALYLVGPVAAILGHLRRRGTESATTNRASGWRAYVPTFLLPIEWLLAPALIFAGIGEFDADLLPLRLAGLAVAILGAAFLLWAAVVLGRFLIHDAAVVHDHTLVTSGPYRYVRHPIYTGYLALLLGTAIASLNWWLFLIWPVSLAGIIVQAGSEERLLRARFGPEYEQYAARTGRLVPRLRT